MFRSILYKLHIYIYEFSRGFYPKRLTKQIVKKPAIFVIYNQVYLTTRLGSKLEKRCSSDSILATAANPDH